MYYNYNINMLKSWWNMNICMKYSLTLHMSIILKIYLHDLINQIYTGTHIERSVKYCENSEENQ